MPKKQNNAIGTTGFTTLIKDTEAKKLTMFIQHIADKQTTKLNPVWLPTT